MAKALSFYFLETIQNKINFENQGKGFCSIVDQTSDVFSDTHL